MKNKQVFKRLLAGVLAVAVSVTAVVVPTAANDNAASDLSNKGISVVSPNRDKLTEEDLGYADDDEVRVSIVLEDASTINAGFDIDSIAVDSKAVAYRDSLKVKQQEIAKDIEKATKEDLDVVHNLTLAANIISANVKYGQIKNIEKVDGVKSVVIETKYDAAKTVEDLPSNPNMATSSAQIGSNVAWADGYTGAGSKVAVIDTGIDSDHQSFSGYAFLYSLKQNAKELGVSFADYKASLNLLDAAKVKALASQLNVAIDPNKTFISDKIPFAYNYIDRDYDITHDNDGQGGHGSHVEGIAAANKYIEDQYGEFITAIDSVAVQGVAPDAQIITMKVFGKGGGAYDSDYMLAIEDAVVLGADSINLSLGSANGGTSKNSKAEYQAIFDSLSKSGAVVSISAGNAGHWADSAYTGGYLYSDDVNSQTDGTPGSFTNAFTVASADNIGAYSEYFTVGGYPIVYVESTVGNSGDPYTNKPISTLAGEQEYVLIDGLGTPEDWAAVGDVLKGKIAVCSRGSINFADKCTNAVKAGAIATIIYNNQPGVIRMDLSDYTYDAPAVTVSQTEGAIMKANAEPSEDGTYYIGTLTIVDVPEAVITNRGHATVSDFSSWGVPGSLEMKPEITAPGGEIYSVDGEPAETDQYVSMSGTSMAAPQVAGMAALSAQYIRETGLDKKTGLSARTLSQSLLMSTADPMIDDTYGSYYSILQQGAGQANIGSVITAESYIIMDKDANAGAEDGKVKVELGDDPARKGVYTFGFTIYNLTNDLKKYTLSADFFTQDLIADGGAFNLHGENDILFDKSTTLLDTDVTFDCGNTVELEANGKQHVKVTVELSADDKEFFDYYAPNGIYIEGFVYAVPDLLYDFDGDGDVDTDDGQRLLDYRTGVEDMIYHEEYADFDGDGDIDTNDARIFLEKFANGDLRIIEGEGIKGTTHSIPVLGFYGNWSTASMFDKGSYEDYYLSGEEGRIPYLAAAYSNPINSLQANVFGVTYGGVDGPYPLGGNPYLDEELYDPDRNAVNGADGTLLSMVQFAAIRNAADSRFIVYNETKKQILVDASLGAVNSAYYHSNAGRWYSYSQSFKPGIDFSQLPGVTEGDKLTITFALAPEYYQDANGNVRWEDVDLTNALTATVTIDNTKPEIISEPVIKDGELTVTVKDNQHVAAILLTNKSGSKVYAYAGSDSNAKPGQEYKAVIDVSEVNADKVYMQVVDYADNSVTYEIDQKFGEGTILPGKIAFNTDFGYYFWTSFEGVDDVDEATVGTMYEESDYLINAATIVDHIVFAIDGEGTLIAMPEADLLDVTEITNFNDYFIEDIIPLDMAYNAKDGKIYVIVGIAEGYDISEESYLIAFDKLECVPEVVGVVPFPTFTLACDEDGNFYSGGRGTGNIYKYTLDAVTGDEEPELVIDLTEDYEELTCGIYSIQAMEYDPNTGKVCWAFYSDDLLSLYIEIDPVKKTYEMSDDLWYQLCALIIPDKSTPSDIPEWAQPTDEITGMTVGAEMTEMFKGTTQKLTVTFTPWTANDADVIWVSMDEDVATVDANGNVKAVGDGTTLVAAFLASDTDIFDYVEITVDTLNVTLAGTLQDADGNPLMYTWNVAEDDTWTATNELKSSMTSATVNTNNGHIYMMDGTTNSWSVHEINPADGSEIAVYPNTMGAPMWDMTYSEFLSTEENPLVYGVYAYYLIGPTDPTALQPLAFDFSMHLMFFTGADYFVAVESLGEIEILDEDTEEMISAERVLAVDNLGYIWTFDVYPLTGEDEGYYGCIYNFSENSCLSEEYPLIEDNDLSASLVKGEDGKLYLSAFDGNTCNLYQLDVDFYFEADEMFEDTVYEMIDCTARKVGEAGDDVWPMLLTSVTVNESASEAEAARPTLVDAASDEVEAPSGEEDTNATVEEEGTIVVDIVPKDEKGENVDATNGLIKVKYDAENLTYAADETVVNAEYYSINVADGEIIIGYVSGEEAIPAGEEAIELVFTYTDASKVDNDSIVVEHVEIAEINADEDENVKMPEEKPLPDPELVTKVDEETGVSVTYYTFLGEGSNATIVVSSEETDDGVSYKVDLVDENGESIDPDSTITVEIEVPEGMDPDAVSVFVKNEDGSYTKIDAELKDGKLVFETDVLGEYVVSEKDLTADTPAPETTPEDEPAPETTPEDEPAPETTPEDSEAPETTPEDTAAPGTADNNPPSGVAIAFVPAVIAAAGVIAAKKRNRK